MNLLTESLWGDEAFSALAIQKPFWEMIGVVMRDTAPPLFYILGQVWGKIFGFSEISLRSLSCLLIIGVGIFSGKIIYEIGKNKLMAVIGGLAVFLSPFLFGFAFEWRMYALLAFLVTGSTYFFVSRKWKGFVIFSALSLYAHHFALFTLAGQGICFLLFEFDWKKFKKSIKSLWPFGLIGLLYLPWIYPMYLQTTRIQDSGFWLEAPKIKEVLNLMFRFLTGGVEENQRMMIMVVVLVLMIGKNWKKVGKRWLELLIIFLSPVVLSSLVSYVITPVFYDRYLLSVVAGTTTLIFLGTRKYFGIMAVLLMLFYGLFSFELFNNPSKRPFRELASYVKEEVKEEDYLINYNGSAHHLWESKYYGVFGPIYTPDGPLPLYVGTAQMTEDDTVDVLPEVKGRIGVISSVGVEEIELGEYYLLDSKNFDELSISWWRK